jgi:hypothetical protein
MSEPPNDGPIHCAWADSSPWSAAPDALQEKGYNITQEVLSCR